MIHILREGDDVLLSAVDKKNLLRVRDMPDCADAVAETCGAFKVKRLRRLLHLLLQTAEQGAAALFDIGQRLVEYRTVLGLADSAAEDCAGADLSRIENEIKTMPNYFADYDTTVHFINMDELKREHSGIPHGGFVIRSGKTGWNGENSHIIEYSLKLDSNPEFTASVIVAYARAAYRMSQNGESGCKTVFDVAPAMLSARSGEELRAHLL